MNQMLIVATILVGACLANPLENANTRVINGEDSEIGEFPFMVALRNWNNHICGGSILNKRFVLTAAHCIYKYQSVVDQFQIHAGTINMQEDGDIYECEQFISHEGFPKERGNDVGLIKVKRDFDFTNPFIKIVSLDASYVPANTVLTAMGFGSSGEIQKIILQKLDVRSLSYEDCNSKQSIAENELCIYASETQGVCFGDSGSPLVHKGTSNQVGVASRVEVPTCTHGHPDMYTRLSPFINWILENSKL